MFDILPHDKNEKDINRQGQLSQRQKKTIATKTRLTVGVFCFSFLASLGACLITFLALPTQRASIPSIVGAAIVYGPGIVIISGYLAFKNLLILQKAKVIKHEGLIQKVKTRQWTRDSIKWYDYWIRVDDIRISIGKKEYDELQEKKGTVYYLSTPNIQKQFLLVDY